MAKLLSAPHPWADCGHWPILPEFSEKWNRGAREAKLWRCVISQINLNGSTANWAFDRQDGKREHVPGMRLRYFRFVRRNAAGSLPAPVSCDGSERCGACAGSNERRVHGWGRSHLPRRLHHPDGRRQPHRRSARGQERQDRSGRRGRRRHGPQVRLDRDRRSRRTGASARIHRPASAYGHRRAHQRDLHRLRLHEIQDPRRAHRDVPRQGGQDAGGPVAPLHQLRQSAAGRRPPDGGPRRRLEGSSDPRLLHQHAHGGGQRRRLRRGEDSFRHRQSAGRRTLRPRRFGQAQRPDL